jgi:sucrose-6-phosphatase
MNKLLLCTDLDRTLIPNGSQPESSKARNLFKQMVNQPEITLAYVTGRDKNLVQKAIKYYQLPNPDYVIADVGATIYKLDNNQWFTWDDWTETIAKDWHNQTNNDVARLLTEFTEIRKQEHVKQKKYKLSYYVPLYIDHLALIQKIQQCLKHEAIQVELIWSIDEPSDMGLLDVMPQHATKRNAIEFLMQQKRFDYHNTVFAGDSGNDLDVILSPVKSIVVANAHQEVKKIAQNQLANQKQGTNIYLAKGDFNHLNGNYSAGILEGVSYYFPEIKFILFENQTGAHS